MDALRIDYKLPVDPGMLRLLEQAKAEARTTGAAVSIAGENFKVDRCARRGKPFALTNPTAWVFIGDRTVHVDLAVPFLAEHTVADAVAHADKIARWLCAPGKDIEAARVMEIDLCGDVAWVTFVDADRGAFVGRLRRGRAWARDFKPGQKDPPLTGLHLGDRRALLFSMYDKTAELRSRHQDDGRAAIEHEQWKDNGWDGQGQVWRAEFQVRGCVLTEYGLRDPARLANHIDAAWQALTRHALRLVDVGAATRRERCPLDPRWEALQRATFIHAGVPPAKRAQRRQGGASAAQMVGVMLSYLASNGVPHETAETVIRPYLASLEALGVSGAHEVIASLPGRIAAAWAQHDGITGPHETALVRRLEPLGGVGGQMADGQRSANDFGDAPRNRQCLAS